METNVKYNLKTGVFYNFTILLTGQGAPASSLLYKGRPSQPRQIFVTNHVHPHLMVAIEGEKTFLSHKNKQFFV